MGQLYEYRKLIEDKVKGLGKDAFMVKGKIGLKAGVMVGRIDADTPDNPDQIRAMKAAIREYLGVAV